jgi:hypothetical protein
MEDSSMPSATTPKMDNSSEALQQLGPPLLALIRFERSYIYKPLVVYRRWLSGGFDEQYLPYNMPVFQLPCYWIQRKHFYIYGCHQSCLDALRWPIGRAFSDDVLFPIHPVSLPFYERFLLRAGARNAADDGLKVFAAPTSSVRTVLAWFDERPANAVFIKLSLMSAPNSGERRVRAEKGAASAGLTRTLEESSSGCHSGFNYFLEPLGVFPRSMPDGGIIIRTVPPALTDNEIELAPLFALLSGSQYRRPLLLALAERSGLTPLDFIDKIFCADFARLWLDSAATLGLLPECHGQNLLIDLRQASYGVANFYYRDLEGLFVDRPLRLALGFPEPHHLPYARSWFDSYGTPFLGPQTGNFWCKLHVSINSYLHLFLVELNECLRSWSDQGLIQVPGALGDHLTGRFSQYILQLMETSYGTNSVPRCNIYKHPTAFYRCLLDIRRRHLLSSNGSRPDPVMV